MSQPPTKQSQPKATSVRADFINTGLLINTPLQRGVVPCPEPGNRFNGLCGLIKTVETVSTPIQFKSTPLKRGVNEGSRQSGRSWREIYRLESTVHAGARVAAARNKSFRGEAHFSAGASFGLNKRRASSRPFHRGSSSVLSPSPVQPHHERGRAGDALSTPPHSRHLALALALPLPRSPFRDDPRLWNRFGKLGGARAVPARSGWNLSRTLMPIRDRLRCGLRFTIFQMRTKGSLAFRNFLPCAAGPIVEI